MAFPTGKTTSGVKSATGGSTYNYYTGVQPNGTPSIGNWNTGGSYAGTGDSRGVFDPMGNKIGGSGSKFAYQGWNDPVQSGPIGPALGPQGLPQPQLPMQPTQVPMGFAPPRRFPTATYPGAGPGQFFDLNDYQDPWSAAYGSYRPGRAMGPGPQGTANWRNNTSGKDQSRLPGFDPRAAGITNGWYKSPSQGGGQSGNASLGGGPVGAGPYTGGRGW